MPLKFTDADIRASLIRAGIKNLSEFGYDSVTPENIVTDYVFRKFFKSMLEDEGSRSSHDGVERVRLALIDEIDACKEPADAPKAKKKKAAR